MNRFVTTHGLPACGKIVFCFLARLHSLDENSGFVSGHDLGRAAKLQINMGFSPCGFFEGARLQF